MATLDYVNIPPGATRLRSTQTKEKTRTSTSSDIKPAPTVFTSLPNPSPPQTPRQRNSMSLPLSASALASPAIGFIPQLLLSASIPGMPTGEDGAVPPGQLPAGPNPRQKLDPEKYTLLSTRDPLSLPIMTNNFKRFVSKVGPVFWLQDRGEEIMLWKKGWKVTATWMALYAFLCYYPRFILLLPHATLIAIILSTYPYPASGQPFSAATMSDSSQDTMPHPAAEGSIPWQANIQAIQNLMGAVSDLFTACEPYVYHFVLAPAHFRDTSSVVTTPGSSTAPGSPTVPTQPVSPYTPHMLTLLICTFPLTAFLISLPVFPVREVCLVAGLAPFVVTHPHIQRLLPYALPLIHSATPIVLAKAELARRRLRLLLTILTAENVRIWNWRQGFSAQLRKEQVEGSSREEPRGAKPVSMIIQRIMDNDRLTDKAWNSEMAEVELWENERLGVTSHDLSHTGSHAPATTGNNKWSKANLRHGERTAWTRGRDGWSGIGPGGMNSGIEASGEVSNLTFSLAPGWSFVETEDWRKDLTGEWSGVGADEDGWVYTNDSWLGPRPAPYTAGGGSVTRRRRWIRRVWYDPDLAKQA